MAKEGGTLVFEREQIVVDFLNVTLFCSGVCFSKVANQVMIFWVGRNNGVILTVCEFVSTQNIENENRVMSDQGASGF